MFAVPPAIETKVLATLPEALRLRECRSDFAQAVSRLLDRACDSFLEGPAFDRHGTLYCVDIAVGRILKISAAGDFSVLVEYEGEPNGLKVHRDGRLFIADRRHGIVRIDPADPRIAVVTDRFQLERLSAPNDLVFSDAGDLYFTDQGTSDLARPTGRVFHLSADGELKLLLDGLPGPNGIALDPSGSVLYVALTRANCIIKATLSANGQLGRVQNFIQLSGGGGPDGLAVDREGGLAVAHPQMGVVWVFSARGEPRLRINLAHGALGTNLAYGGPDNRTLYITESETGTIQTADLSIPGLRLFSHR